MSQTGQWGQPPSNPGETSGPVNFFNPAAFQKAAPSDFPPVPQQNQDSHNPQQDANKSGGNAGTSWEWNHGSNPYLTNTDTSNNAGNQQNGTAINNPWPDQSQWTQQQQQSYQNQMNYNPNEQQWNANQQALNPNVPEWNPNQFYQQQQHVDPNQQYGYSQYWSGDNYYTQDVTASQAGENSIPNSNVVTDTQSNTAETGAPTNAQYTQPNSIAQSQTSVQSQFSQEEYSHEQSNDVSQSTESESQDASTESESLEQSDQTYEGSVGAYFGNDDNCENVSPSEFSHHRGQNLPNNGPHQSENVENFQQAEFLQNKREMMDTQPGSSKNNSSVPAHQMQTVSLYDRQTSETVPAQDNQQHIGNYNTAQNPQEHQHMNHFNEALNSQEFTPQADFNALPQTFSEVKPVTEGAATTDNRHVTDNDESKSLDDWELVHAQGGVVSTASHSRNTSLDNNVHFFISSNNSSQRVSPAGSAKSKKSEEPESEVNLHDGGHVNAPAMSENQGQVNHVPNVMDHHRMSNQPGHGYGQVISQPGSMTSHLPSSQKQNVSNVPNTSQKTDGINAPPLNRNLLGPPPIGLGKGSNNAFQKSPVNYASPNIGDSVLSSTRLDVTKNDFENSPVVLSRSISPIQSDIFTNTKPKHCDYTENRDIENSEESSIALDTPVSVSGPRKTGPVAPSPIMHRKESAFQPPGPGARRDPPESRVKPVKASHSIPGVQPQPIQKPQKILQQENEYGKDTDFNADGKRDKNYGRKTPEWDRPRSDRSLNYGRKTPELDRQKRYGGRRTPDLDATNKQTDRSYGRKTPEWDRNMPEGDGEKEGRATGDRYLSTYKERMEAYKERMEAYRERRQTGNDRVSSRPPINPTAGSSRTAPSRNGPSSLRTAQAHRSRNNVSPATTLWDTDVPAVSNILLVPTMGNSTTEGGKVKSDNSGVSHAPSVLTPVATLITSLSEQIDTTDSDKVRSQGQTKSGTDDRTRNSDTRTGYGDRSRDSLDRDRDREKDSRELTRNSRSYDSDRGLQYSRNSSRDKLDRYGSRNSLDGEVRDESDDRDHRRGNSRDRDRDRHRGKDDFDRYYRDRDRRDTERPLSRTGPGDRSRDGHRSTYSRRDERHERPRSRHDDPRPPSRQGDTDRPRSRTDLDRDHYDKYKGYDYDDYYRRGGQHYDRQYYDYYYGNQSYNQGYYDDMGYYHSDPNASRYTYDQRNQRRSRVSTPGSMSDGGDEMPKVYTRTQRNSRFDYPPELRDYTQAQYDEYYNYYGQYPQVEGHCWDPHISAWVATTVEAEPHRQTPEKFIIPHVRACFGPSGQLVKVLPNRPTDGQPATIEIHDVQAMLEHNEEYQEYKEYPGPLVRGDTHKNDVLLYCQRKAKACVDNMDLDDRESAELIWRLLELLIKQNGTVVGTDIADLILEGHEPTTMDYRRTGMRIAQSSSDFLEGADDDVSDDHGNVTMDRTSISKAKPVEETTDRFRHLLLYGRKKDALDWAMKNNLWGHALFLASKMDSRAHANVMARFANVAMRMNDPLQTLFQLMSGRQPAAVTCVTEERWGDWRPHLAMILSNHTSRPDLDRKCITQLGDTLASKGYLHASHFCYLMSQATFGSFQKKTSKIVLIGSSHNLPLDLFTNNDAIQCTEVYEYALALGNTSGCLSNFQYFKYLYATRLADCGFAQEALQYCEVISRTVQTNPAFYTLVLVKLLYDLSCQLKFADPQRLEEADDLVDPDWLRGLHTTLVQFEEGAIQPMSAPETPAYFPGTRASSESGEVGMYMQENIPQTGQGQGYSLDNTYAQSGYMHGIPEQANSNLQVGTSQNQYQTGAVVDNQYDQGTVDQTQYIHQSQPGTAHTGTSQEGIVHNQIQYQEGIGNQSHYGVTGEQYQHATFEGQAQGQVATENQATSHYQPYNTTDAAHNMAYNQANQHAVADQQQQPPHTNFPLSTSLTESMNSGTGTRHSIASTSSWTNDEDDGGDGADTVDGDTVTNQGIFDIIQPNQPQKIIPPRLRKRTASETSTSNNTARPAAHEHTDNMASMMDLKPQKNAAGGEGIWGKIGGLFSRKGKNEMKLPDDKEPAIVWDPVNNKWMNTDSDGTDSAPAAPPPKDADLTGKPSFSQPPSFPPATPSVTSSMTEPGPLDQSALSANRFQRRKGIGARSQYVDVLNPKPATTNQVPSSLFHTLPSSQSAPAIFVPGGGASQTEETSEPESQPVRESIPEESKAPPQPHNLPPPIDNLSRTSSASSLNREVQRILSKDQAPPPIGSSVPSLTMFNPAQFQTGSNVKPPSSGPGHRLTNRRIYPKQGTS